MELHILVHGRLLWVFVRFVLVFDFFFRRNIHIFVEHGLLVNICTHREFLVYFTTLIKKEKKNNSQFNGFDFQYFPIWNFYGYRAIIMLSFVCTCADLCLPFTSQSIRRILPPIVKTMLWHFDSFFFCLFVDSFAFNTT